MVNIYGSLYELILNYLFGGAINDNETKLIAILLSSIGTIFVFSLPFLVVWKVLKIVVGA